METDCMAAGDCYKRWEAALGSANGFVYLLGADEDEGWVEN